MLQNKKWTNFVIWMENEVSIVLKDPLPYFFPSFCQWLPVWASLSFISFEYYELVECSLQFMEFGNTSPCFVAPDNKHSCLAGLCPFCLIYLYFPTIWTILILIQQSQGLLYLGPSLTQLFFTNIWVINSSSILQSEHMPGPWLLLLCK